MGADAIETTAEGARRSVINGEALFPEGPLVRDGLLYYAEYGGDRVSIWDGRANRVLWSRPGCGASAIAAFGSDFAVMCYASGEVAVISKEGATIAVHDRDDAGRRLDGPNDATGDGAGGIYFTTSGPWEPGPIVGRVLHMNAAGRIRAVADDLHYANGIERTSDGSRLLVNESEANRVVSFRIEPDGSLSDRRLFVRMRDLGQDAAAFPDGIKLGPDGNYYVGLCDRGRIVVMSPDARPLGAIDVPSAAAPNLAFSADGKTIFITAVDDTANAPFRGKVYAVPLWSRRG